MPLPHTSTRRRHTYLGEQTHHKAPARLSQHDARLLPCKTRVDRDALRLVRVQLVMEQADEGLVGNIPEVAPAVQPSHALQTAHTQTAHTRQQSAASWCS